jgi:hypothetical protein
VAEADGPAAGKLGCFLELTAAEGCSGLTGELTEADGCSGEAGAVAEMDGPVAGTLGISGFLGE